MYLYWKFAIVIKEGANNDVDAFKSTSRTLTLNAISTYRNQRNHGLIRRLPIQYYLYPAGAETPVKV